MTLEEALELGQFYCRNLANHEQGADAADTLARWKPFILAAQQYMGSNVQRRKKRCNGNAVGRPEKGHRRNETRGWRLDSGQDDTARVKPPQMSVVRVAVVELKNEASPNTPTPPRVVMLWTGGKREPDA